MILRVKPAVASVTVRPPMLDRSKVMAQTKGDTLRQRIRNTDLTFGTWNVQTMLQPGKMMEIADEVLKLGIDLVALQEIRWQSQGEIKKKNFTVIYSGPENLTVQYGTGFIISRKIRESILEYEPVNDRLCRLRI
jgi:hypothetical protein